MKNDLIKVAIAEHSLIIRSGLASVLKRIPGFRMQTLEIASVDSLHAMLRLQKPDILIVNPLFLSLSEVQKLREQHEGLQCMALVTAAVDELLLKQYNDTVSVYDSIEQLRMKFERAFADGNDENTDETGTLSVREKEVLVCVVKGLTNKEIAQELFLSTHTVISHRRNIARKLEIHSAAGLTIYAIVNKLVEIDEIKKDLLS